MIRTRDRQGPPRTISPALAACLTLALASHARSDVINFTGNVANDFPKSLTTTVVPGVPESVAQSPYITQNGWTTGFLVESLRLNYDKASDTLYVGVQTYSITGDADGNGNPGYTDPKMAAAGGVNFAHFGGDKSLTLAFANAAPGGGHGPADFVAGIPADKSTGDSRNTNEFTVATYADRGRGLGYAYGTILNNHVGKLEVDPSASAPNFEFAVTNFSKIPGFNPSGGFYVSLFLGSQEAIVVGKEAMDWTKVPVLVPEPGSIAQQGGPLAPPRPAALTPSAVPEPGSVVLFFIGAAATAGGLARSRRRASRA